MVAIHDINRGITRSLNLFLSSEQSRRVLAPCVRGIQLTGGSFSGQINSIERLWRDFFSNPSQWWDYRSGKVNPQYPDFKNKITQESLWLSSKLNPPWVKAELGVLMWNMSLARHVKAGRYKETLELFQKMQQEGMNPNTYSFVQVLGACSNLKALEEGKCIHTQIINCGCASDLYVGNCLVDMYSKCGSIEDAYRIFNAMPRHDVVSWNGIIRGYVKSGQGQKALKLAQKMQQEGVEPNPRTFVGLLNACASLAALEEGRLVHEQILQKGCESNIFIGSSLVDMYVKCGSTKDAWGVFAKMSMRDVVAWSAMILGHVKCGEGQKALELFQQMQLEGVRPDRVIFVGLLHACASIEALEEGKGIHEQIIQRGFESDVFVGNGLVDMYSKCGSIVDAQMVFNKMAMRDVVSWTAMIVAYVSSGERRKALELFKEMHASGVKPNNVMFVRVLNACSSVAALEEGRFVHEQIIQSGYESDVIVGNCLVDMYCKCGSIGAAWRVFSEMPVRDLVGWSAMILGYVKCGQGKKALELYYQMQQGEVDPDPVTFAGVLNACASVGALEEGRCVHDQIIQHDWESKVLIGNCLVDMYAKCGSIADARSVFDKMPVRNVVAWSAMILAYAKQGQGQEALELFWQMQCKGVEPNSITFVAVLNACAIAVAPEEGRRVHEQIIQTGCESDVFVSSSLVDMYIKCGSIEDAWTVFNKMVIRDVVAWSTMILGYMKYGEGQKALELYQQMQVDGVDPDPIIFVGVLNACASVAALRLGRLVHKQIIQSGCESDVFIGSSLVDMYAKSGSIEDAQDMFNKMSTKNMVSCNAILGGYAVHGQAKEALEHFEWMWQEDVEMDGVTFVCILSACSHGGLVDEGLHYFELMTAVYNIRPSVEHYSCLIDLFGRVGRLHEAQDLVETMLCEPNVALWSCLLGACKIHGNVEMGGHVAKRVLELDPEDPAGYVLLSNIYAASGMWDSSADIQARRREFVSMSTQVHLD